MILFMLLVTKWFHWFVMLKKIKAFDWKGLKGTTIIGSSWHLERAVQLGLRFPDAPAETKTHLKSNQPYQFCS